MFSRLFGPLLLATLVSAPAMAGEYTFVLTNTTDSRVVGAHAEGGQIVGFSPVAANGEKSFTIVLPDGVCITRVQFVFDDSEATAIDGYDACNGGGVDLSY